MRGKTAVYAVVVLAAIGAVSEIGLRAALGLGAPVLFRVSSQYGAFPVGGQNLRRFGKDIRTNEQGMRSDPLPPVHRSDEVRILLVGDSVPFGTTLVDQNDIAAQRILKKLRDAGHANVTVLNASSPGWAPENEYKYISAEGIFSADYVFMVYNTKDLSQRFSPFRASPITPTENPPLALIELWSRYLSPRLGLSANVVDTGSTSDDGPPNPIDAEAVLETTQSAKDFVESKGAQFGILYIPAQTSDVTAHRAEWDRTWSAMKNWAETSGAYVIDTSEDLYKAPHEATYLDGIHLRPGGNEAVGADFLRWYSSLNVSQAQ
jgi:hypothetical protein